MDKEDMVYIHNGILFSHKKTNEIMPFAATWMDQEIVILVKSEREKQIPYNITYMCNLKYDTNEFIYKIKQIHRHREETCSC